MTQALEETIAHLVKTVDDLSDIVARQDAELTQLRRLVDVLVDREKAREAEGGGGVIMGDERPPHY